MKYRFGRSILKVTVLLGAMTVLLAGCFTVRDEDRDRDRDQFEHHDRDDDFHGDLGHHEWNRP